MLNDYSVFAVEKKARYLIVVKRAPVKLDADVPGRRAPVGLREKTTGIGDGVAGRRAAAPVLLVPLEARSLVEGIVEGRARIHHTRHLIHTPAVLRIVFVELSVIGDAGMSAHRTHEHIATAALVAEQHKIIGGPQSDALGQPAQSFH